MNASAIVEICKAVLTSEVPGSDIPLVVLGELTKDYIDKRLKRNLGAICDELGKGVIDEFDAAQKDELIGCLLRLRRALLEGTARLNLRLMASVVRGMCVQSCLTADEFLYHADWLATLRREEIVILGTFQKYGCKSNEDGNQEEIYKAVKGELVSSVMDKKMLEAYCMSSSRTGLVISYSGWDGHVGFKISPLLTKLCEIVDFRDVLARDEADTDNTNPKA